MTFFLCASSLIAAPLSGDRFIGSMLREGLFPFSSGGGKLQSYAGFLRNLVGSEAYLDIGDYQNAFAYIRRAEISLRDIAKVLESRWNLKQGTLTDPVAISALLKKPPLSNAEDRDLFLREVPLYSLNRLQYLLMKQYLAQISGLSQYQINEADLRNFVNLFQNKAVAAASRIEESLMAYYDLFPKSVNPARSDYLLNKITVCLEPGTTFWRQKLQKRCIYDLLSQGYTAEAVSVMESYVDENPESLSPRIRALVYFANQQDEEALSTVENYLNLSNPTDLESWRDYDGLAQLRIDFLVYTQKKADAIRLLGVHLNRLKQFFEKNYLGEESLTWSRKRFISYEIQKLLLLKQLSAEQLRELRKRYAINALSNTLSDEPGLLFQDDGGISRSSKLNFRALLTEWVKRKETGLHNETEKVYRTNDATYRLLSEISGCLAKFERGNDAGLSFCVFTLFPQDGYSRQLDFQFFYVSSLQKSNPLLLPSVSTKPMSSERIFQLAFAREKLRVVSLASRQKISLLPPEMRLLRLRRLWLSGFLDHFPGINRLPLEAEYIASIEESPPEKPSSSVQKDTFSVWLFSRENKTDLFWKSSGSNPSALQFKSLNVSRKQWMRESQAIYAKPIEEVDENLVLSQKGFSSFSRQLAPALKQIQDGKVELRLMGGGEFIPIEAAILSFYKKASIAPVPVVVRKFGWFPVRPFSRNKTEQRASIFVGIGAPESGFLFSQSAKDELDDVMNLFPERVVLRESSGFVNRLFALLNQGKSVIFHAAGGWKQKRGKAGLFFDDTTEGISFSFFGPFRTIESAVISENSVAELNYDAGSWSFLFSKMHHEGMRYAIISLRKPEQKFRQAFFYDFYYRYYRKKKPLLGAWSSTMARMQKGFARRPWAWFLAIYEE